VLLEYQDSGCRAAARRRSSSPLLLQPQPGPLNPVGKLALQIFGAFEVAAMLALSTAAAASLSPVVLQIFEEFLAQVDQNRERGPNDDDPSDIGKAHKKPGTEHEMSSRLWQYHV
jgi:hypothetical protein